MQLMEVKLATQVTPSILTVHLHLQSRGLYRCFFYMGRILGEDRHVLFLRHGPPNMHMRLCFIIVTPGYNIHAET